MPKLTKPLSPSEVQNAKAGAKMYVLRDGQGLLLHVEPHGTKLWRLDYRRPGTGKRNLLSLGAYPDVSLKRAREKRDEARKLLADGIDPGEKRKAEAVAGASTFEAVAREWHAKHSPNWTQHNAEQVLVRLEKNVLPWIGGKPIATLTAPDVLAVMQRIDARGARESAHRAKMTIGQILRYAVATGRAQFDVTQALRGALPPAQTKGFASIREPAKIGELLRAIDGYAGSPIARAALQLAPLVFVRPGELRAADWREFNLAGAEWRIPAERMKMRQPHIVPLSRQAVAVLRELQPLTGSAMPDKPDAPQYLFASLRTRMRPMSENTVNAALRRMGYDKDTMTGHGFRSMASTLLNEQGWHGDAIERQLAHGEPNAVRAAYNYAEHLPERRKMMQAWADYLDALRTNANVLPFKRKA